MNTTSAQFRIEITNTFRDCGWVAYSDEIFSSRFYAEVIMREYIDLHCYDYRPGIALRVTEVTA